MKVLLASAILTACVAMQASAAENFIPTGPGYSTAIDSLAELNSERDQITLGADIIETDIYQRAREAQQRDSHLRRFFSEQENSGSDFSIDY
jgi:hypothetical protein